MLPYLVAFGVALATLLGGPAAAQAPPADPDPGVKLTRLIDRPEVRVSRLVLQPGAARRAHAHDDVEYHLWIPIEGRLQLTIGSDAPVSAELGQAFFLKRGTAHAFKNIGTTPASVFEIFVKQPTTAAADPLGVIAAELAALRLAESQRR